MKQTNDHSPIMYKIQFWGSFKDYKAFLNRILSMTPSAANFRILKPPLTLHKKMKFFIKNFFSKCEQIRCKLRIWSHLLKKFFMENFIFLCTVSRTLQNYLFKKKDVLHYTYSPPTPYRFVKWWTQLFLDFLYRSTG